MLNSYEKKQKSDLLLLFVVVVQVGFILKNDQKPYLKS